MQSGTLTVHLPLKIKVYLKLFNTPPPHLFWTIPKTRLQRNNMIYGLRLWSRDARTWYGRKLKWRDLFSIEIFPPKPPHHLPHPLSISFHEPSALLKKWLQHVLIWKIRYKEPMSKPQSMWKVKSIICNRSTVCPYLRHTITADLAPVPPIPSPQPGPFYSASWNLWENMQK